MTIKCKDESDIYLSILDNIGDRIVTVYNDKTVDVHKENGEVIRYQDDSGREKVLVDKVVLEKILNCFDNYVKCGDCPFRGVFYQCVNSHTCTDFLRNYLKTGKIVPIEEETK